MKVKAKPSPAPRPLTTFTRTVKVANFDRSARITRLGGVRGHSGWGWRAGRPGCDGITPTRRYGFQLDLA